jgi:hypothetical protein
MLAPAGFLLPPVEHVLVTSGDTHIPRGVRALILVAAHAVGPVSAPTLGDLAVPDLHPAFEVEQPLNAALSGSLTLLLVLVNYALDAVT